MIDQQTRQIIHALHQKGYNARKIASDLNLSRNAVRAAILLKGEMPQGNRKDKIEFDPVLLGKLYTECDGRSQRLYEILTEEHGVHMKYSTLTRMLRDLSISTSVKLRCEREPDQPGVEMQHDTSDYKVKLGGKMVKLICSLLYLRYSKRRYLIFYRAFNRFKMKCFFHKALMYWGFSACNCIIDNTNLARKRGTGKNALIAAEMTAFSSRYGFTFHCHEIKHSNRKAGNERSFFTVTTNFLAGRTFTTLEDLNAQAFEWATKRLYHRPVAKSGMIPAKAFEHEIPYLNKLPEKLPAPYWPHERVTDQYGYISFDANYYWVPGIQRDTLKVLEYDAHLELYRRRELLASYPFPNDGVRNKLFSPAGKPAPKFRPKNRKKPTAEEQKRLRAMDSTVGEYLDFALKVKGLQPHHFVRGLFTLSGRVSASLFIATVKRALRYRITRLETLERIAVLDLTATGEMFSNVEVDEHLQQRESYIEGQRTDAPDFSEYEQMLDIKDDGDDGNNDEDGLIKDNGKATDESPAKGTHDG